ncbi:telomerase protein component 1 isoform X2 [Xenopus laevis]|uniref:Telomerase protein component 1 isoform X2 n=1 Tax=Xenopus laevis TaxID=8355 RepID=A0A8J0VAF1_XENLA|nr:telomerase protein component 1 isoform X2 [Xenopus laevis]
MGSAVTSMKNRASGSGTVQESVQDLDEMWSIVDSWTPKALPSSSCSHLKGWKTVRVFVSSTFGDFHSEREVLIKQVFPELREWCEARNLCLVECDLRWGIPQDTPSSKILATCLGELDRCKQDTYENPLMVILLGERAGWIPDISEVPSEVVEQYHWIPGMSITGMEILHGAYRNSNPNAAFCFRDPSFLGQLPLQELTQYQETGQKALLMQSLKQHVCHRFTAKQILKYKCKVQGKDCTSGSEKVRLGFSCEFTSWILQFLKTRIIETFPGHTEAFSETEKPSWEQTEETQHQLFLQQRCQLFLGRDLEVQRILEFLQVEFKDSTQQINCVVTEAEGGVKLPCTPVLQIISEPGMGKSSLLAACLMRAVEIPNMSVFYHFTGCCPSSAQLSNLAMRVCCHVLPAGPEREDVMQRLRDCSRNEDLKEVMRQILKSSPVSPNKTLCLFIDAVNQLSNPRDVSDLLSWLTTDGFLPPSCRCVFSSTITNAHSPFSLQLELLSPQSSQELAVKFLSRYSKLLCLMHCSPEGGIERDLCGALSELEGGPDIPPLHWVALRRTLGCLLRLGQDHRGRDTLSFFHGSVVKAIELSLLQTEASRQPYLSSMSSYYEHRCSDDMTVVSQLPRLLQEAKLGERLIHFLRKDPRALCIPAQMRAQYMKVLRCSQVCRDGFPRSPALLCSFCSLKTRAFGQLFLNKQSCVVCGATVMINEREAFLCPQHFRHGVSECLVCKTPILGPNKPSPGLLCNFCGFSQTCITIKL